MDTIMESLAAKLRMASLNEENIFIAALQHDMETLLAQHHACRSSIVEHLGCPLQMQALFAQNPSNVRLFFTAYPTENALYQQLDKIIKALAVTSLYMEIFPFIDEYIEILFSWQQY